MRKASLAGALCAIPLMFLLAADVRPGKKDEYDPTNLGPGEVACGHNVKDTCKCLKYRMDESQKAIERCLQERPLVTGKDFKECMAKNPACSVAVLDAEGRMRANGVDDVPNAPLPEEGMAAHCKRTCRKARCLCCRS